MAQGMWVTVDCDAVTQSIDAFRDACEALPDDIEHDDLRELGRLTDSTWKYLVMFQPKGAGMLNNPVHFAGEILPTQRFQELLTFINNKDVHGAIDHLRKLEAVANRHQPAHTEVTT